MNWLKKLCNSLVSKTSTSPKLVVVDEEPTPVEVEEDGDCAEIFLHILQEAGVSKHVKKINGVELFVEWYNGPCNEESIRNAIDDFKEAHPAVAAKIAGKL